MEWTLEPADTAAAPRLRRQILRALRRIAAEDADLAATEIVVGELLSNALAHTAGRAWISLRWDGVHPLLSVADLGPGFGVAPRPDRPGDRNRDRDRNGNGTSDGYRNGDWDGNSHGNGNGNGDGPQALVDADGTLVPRLPDDPLAEGGRGLYLIAHLALDVAVAARSTGGTVVSVTLDLKRAS